LQNDRKKKLKSYHPVPVYAARNNGAAGAVPARSEGKISEKKVFFDFFADFDLTYTQSDLIVCTGHPECNSSGVEKHGKL
jgi:hypothetical protein